MPLESLITSAHAAAEPETPGTVLVAANAVDRCWERVSQEQRVAGKVQDGQEA